MDLLDSEILYSRFDDLLYDDPEYSSSWKPDFLRRETPPKKPDMFQFLLNIKHFKPKEVGVKTVDKSVIIHAKHEELMDEHGFVTREFKRQYELPDTVDPGTVTAAITEDGILIISAPKKQPDPPAGSERIVPISKPAQASLEEKKALWQEQRKQSANQKPVIKLPESKVQEPMEQQQESVKPDS